jgi:hypothetical protein
MVCWDPERREAVRAMIAEVEGKPCVNVGDHDGGVAATVPVLNTGRSRAGRACSTRRTGENTIRRA